MKKTLLALSLICALSIPSIHAGVWDYLPWSSTLPIPESASQEYHDAAKAFDTSVSNIRTEERRQDFIYSAKKNALITIAALGGATFCYTTLKDCLKPDIVATLFVKPLEAFPKALSGLHYNDQIQKGIPALLGLPACGLMAGIYGTNTVYNGLRALCIKKLDEEEFKKNYTDSFWNLIDASCEQDKATTASAIFQAISR